MIETFGDSGNSAKVYDTVKAYTTNNKLFAEITNVPNKTAFKAGSTLKLVLGVAYQHTLEGHNVSQEQFEKTDLNEIGRQSRDFSHGKDSPSIL